MRLEPIVGMYGVLEKTEEGWKDAGSTMSQIAEHLSQSGIRVALSPTLVYDDSTADQAARYLREIDPDLLLAVIITWSFDNLTVRILKTVHSPLAILAIPGIRAGSIVGAHQLGSLLTDMGVTRSIFYGAVRDAGTYPPLVSCARAAAVKRRLERGKIASVGRRTPGMTPIAVDEVDIMRTFGAQMVWFDWDDIQDVANDLDGAQILDAVSALRLKVGSVTSSEESLRDSVANYLALKKIAEAEGILIYGLGCYPKRAGVVCLTNGLLCEDGISAACEGDINAGIVMYLINALTGVPAHFGEILEIDADANTITTSHCGCAAPSLASSPDEIELSPVRIWNRGTCIRFPARSAAEATYVNLAGRKANYRMCGVTGSAIQTEMVFEGNPVKLHLDCPWRRLMRTIDEYGFGHHWLLGYGAVIEELRYFCKLTGINGVFPGTGETSDGGRSKP